MASIYGIQLKAVKKTMGMEGEGFVSNLYMDRKKIGTACDYADGGMIYVSVQKEKEEFSKRVRQYYTNHPQEDFVKRYNDITSPEEYIQLRKAGQLPIKNAAEFSDMELAEDFCNELYKMYDLEQIYKKQIKKGFLAIVTVEFVHIKSTPLPMDKIYYTDGSRTTFEDIKKTVERKTPAVILKQYDSFEDFVNPLP